MPKIVDKEERRREICLAAIDLFSQKGYEKVTIKEIAEASGIGKGTVYEYFESKEDILLKSTKQFFVEVIDNEFLKDIDFTNPIEGIETFARETVRVFKENNRDFFLAYFELLLVNLRNISNEEMLNDIKDIFFQYRTLLKNVMDEGKTKGMIPSHIDTNKLAISLFAYLDGLMLHCWINNALGEEDDFEQINESFMSVFLKGLEK
ncbi:TetR/AcrR family transcriptional regulator [Wukongibacter baidiensis]|uniref:TetR/AcrR family transcriptional regulator n=1 Tax=Wukongibacter baidiensis TaxID=1723361 RepID=UPI003D7F7336